MNKEVAIYKSWSGSGNKELTKFDPKRFEEILEGNGFLIKEKTECCSSIPRPFFVDNKTKDWPKPCGESITGTAENEHGETYISTDQGIYKIVFEMVARTEKIS